jgi:hypothetical protein
MKIQEAKITRDGFSTYYFQHSFRSGKQHAKEQFDKLVKDNNYNKIELFYLNENLNKPKWTLIESYSK